MMDSWIFILYFRLNSSTTVIITLQFSLALESLSCVFITVFFVSWWGVGRRGGSLAETYFFFLFFFQGKAWTQSPTTTNYAVEFPTFGEIAGVSTSGVQWISLALGKPPSWSWYLPCQVSRETYFLIIFQYLWIFVSSVCKYCPLLKVENSA